MNMQQEIEADMITRDEYQAAAARLDQLWGKATTAADRAEIEHLLHLIEACDACTMTYMGKK
ncbi:hypothetical protein ACO0LO_24745 [Undibacterium sp. TJN25]|uniref:hypothetical protein n=1 Tax=Undibacterium sp. TJN25 TaxID=3413056 RepID=UPI003BF41C50